MAPEYIPPLRILLRLLIAIAVIGALLYVILGSRIAALIALTPLLGMALVLAVLAAMTALLVAIGRYVLGPLDRAARHWMRPTQFTMVDFLSLIFLFQLPMAALQALDSPRGERPGAYWLLCVFCWIVTASMWGFSVRTLSRAGIENTWHRGAFLALVLPVAYFGSIVFLSLIWVAGAAIWIEGVPSRNDALLVLAVLAGLLAGFFLSARFVRKMVAASALGSGSSPLAVQESLVQNSPAELQTMPAPGAEPNVDLPRP